MFVVDFVAPSDVSAPHVGLLEGYLNNFCKILARFILLMSDQLLRLITRRCNTPGKRPLVLHQRLKQTKKSDIIVSEKSFFFKKKKSYDIGSKISYRQIHTSFFFSSVIPSRRGHRGTL